MYLVENTYIKEDQDTDSHIIEVEVDIKKLEEKYRKQKESHCGATKSDEQTWRKQQLSNTKSLENDVVVLKPMSYRSSESKSCSNSTS